MKVVDMAFKMGHELKICVKTNDDCCNFSINVGHDSENLALHFNPRFDYGGDGNIIVFNSLSGGSWGDEQREGHFPFTRGEEHKFFINFNNEQFYIKLPDGNMMNFPNRLGDVKYEYFEVRGDAKLISIRVK